VKITIENLCMHLSEDVYAEGIDPETLCCTMEDIYKWITGTQQRSTIQLPAPINDLDDRHRTMWPEGAKVTTRARRDSHSSSHSRKSSTSNGVKVPNINKAYTSSRNSSNATSRYAPVKARFIEDEYPDEVPRSVSLRDVRASGIRTMEQRAPGPKGRIPAQSIPIRENQSVSAQRPSDLWRQKMQEQMDAQQEDDVEHIDYRATAKPAQLRSLQLGTNKKRRDTMPVFVEDE
jgi:hypothetical protein